MANQARGQVGRETRPLQDETRQVRWFSRYSTLEHVVDLLTRFPFSREEILPDASRAGPFCMHQYTRSVGLG